MLFRAILLFVLSVSFFTDRANNQILRTSYYVTNVDLESDPRVGGKIPEAIQEAIFSVYFDRDIYIRPLAGCSLPNICNQTNFAPCCLWCDPSTHIPYPNNTIASCICPQFPGAICLDNTKPWIGI